MSIRMIEYDFAVALERAWERDDSFEINFPHSCVLYLRHNRNTPEQLWVKLNMPDGEQMVYQVPTVKVQEYTRDEIFQKRLLFFLPFYIMRYEKELPGISGEPSRLKKLVREYEEIRKQLGNLLAGGEKADLYLRLMEVVKEISDYVLRQEKPAQKRIGDIMGGKVLELEVDRMLARGRQQILEEGRRTGLEEGRRTGFEESRRSLALRMLESGEPEDKILLYSGCTREELERIKSYWNGK